MTHEEKSASNPQVALLWAVLPLVLTAFFAVQMATIGSDAREIAYDWIPALNVQFALRLDGLSILFALLISGIGSLVMIYSASYMSHSPFTGRFYVLLYLFMGAMLGLVLADNLITLSVFWELTSISSYGLISIESDRKEARDAALQALFVTSAGGLAMLGGFVLLGQLAGTYQISEIIEGGSISGSEYYTPILVLILIGAFTKSAQVPFHFWLPNAMEAPTPISAYLHSATMVKAGVYLLARLTPVLAETDTWYYAVSGIGAVTMVVGAAMAIAQTDLKRVLAYSTLSILGQLIFLLGIGSEEAVLGAMVLLVAHAGYKATLFLCAGIIDHETGTRDIRELGGLAKALPVTAACVFVAALSMAGIAPMIGFISKETMYEALLHADRYEVLVTGAAIVANALLGAVAIMLFVRPFLGPLRSYGHAVHEADARLLAGPVVLSVLGLAAAFLPSQVDSALVGEAAGQISGAFGADLYLWHGFTLALGLSGLTIAIAIAAFLAREQLTMLVRSGVLAGLAPETVYTRSMDGLVRGADGLTRLVQNGYLRVYFTVILTTAIALIGGTALAKADLELPSFEPTPRFEELGVALITTVGALLTIVTRSRIIAIIGLGFAGYGVALIYTFFGAPDLAMTQILVETLTVLLMIFAFYRLPRFARYSRVSTRARDALLSVAAGATMSILLLTTLTVEQDRTLSTRLSELSKPEAFGSNVVNVILVDFRAMDTLGEITVLALAAIGIASLLGVARRRSDQ